VPGFAESISEYSGAVAGSVVGHHGLDLESRGGEERGGAGPESGRSFFLLVAEDLGIGQAGVIVDGVVQERVAAASFFVVAVADSATVNPVAAPVGDAAEFLDINVDQLARPGFLVTDRP
jgi:hypothetical protein